MRSLLLTIILVLCFFLPDQACAAGPACSGITVPIPTFTPLPPTTLTVAPVGTTPTPPATTPPPIASVCSCPRNVSWSAVQTISTGPVTNNCSYSRPAALPLGYPSEIMVAYDNTDDPSTGNATFNCKCDTGLGWVAEPGATCTRIYDVCAGVYTCSGTVSWTANQTLNNGITVTNSCNQVATGTAGDFLDALDNSPAETGYASFICDPSQCNNGSGGWIPAPGYPVVCSQVDTTSPPPPPPPPLPPVDTTSCPPTTMCSYSPLPVVGWCNYPVPVGVVCGSTGSHYCSAPTAGPINIAVGSTYVLFDNDASDGRTGWIVDQCSCSGALQRISTGGCTGTPVP